MGTDKGPKENKTGNDKSDMATWDRVVREGLREEEALELRKTRRIQPCRAFQAQKP